MEWLSAFGGQLSLFIGASVITMMELAAFGVRLLMLVAGRMVGALCSAPSEKEMGETKGEKFVALEERKVKISVSRVAPVST